MGDPPGSGPGLPLDAGGSARPGDFDAHALVEGLDRQRSEMALSRRRVAEAIWAQSSVLDAVRRPAADFGSAVRW
jgi:hypothetical protein